jgi:hypothetical protein
MTWLGAVARLAPIVADVAMQVIPHFTQRRTGEPAAIEDGAVPQQIAELQRAALQNAENIRKLASDLQEALLALEQAGEAMEQRVRRAERLAWVGLAVSIVLAAALLALWRG